MDTQPKILKSMEHTNSSENTAEEYENLVQQEDEHIERLKTCTHLGCSSYYFSKGKRTANGNRQRSGRPSSYHGTGPSQGIV
ncbi:hypothetical protein ACWGXJ_17945 [Paenibacillus sp. S33]